MLCYLLWEQGGGSNDALPWLLMAALTHDLAEQSVGDVPAPTKWAVLGLANQLEDLEQAVLTKYGFSFVLDHEQRRILKLADALEGLLYCTNELNMGNRKKLIIGQRWVDYLINLQVPEGSVSNIVYSIIEVWRDAVNGEAPADFTQLEVEEFTNNV